MTTPTISSPHLILLGSIAEGFSPIGPFDSAADARAWADHHCAGNGDAGDTCTIMAMTAPAAAELAA